MVDIKEDLTNILKLNDQNIQRIEIKFDDKKVISISVDYATNGSGGGFIGFGAEIQKDGKEEEI